MPAPDISVQETAPEGRSLAMTIYAGASNPRPIKERSVEWAHIVDQFNKRDIRPDKDGKAFSFVRLKSGSTRKNENVESFSAVVLDIDDGTSLEELTRPLLDYEFLAVSTHNHTKARPKFRVVLPVSRDVSPIEWPIVWTRINELVGGHADKAAKDLSRLYYFPSCPAETADEAFFKHNSGRWLDPDALFLEKPHLVSSEASHAVNFGAADGIESSPDGSLQCRDGDRTNHLVKLVGHWISEDLGRDAIIEKALQWNANNLPPLPAQKVEKTCASMWESYARKPITEANPTSVIPAPAPQLAKPVIDVSVFSEPRPTTPLFELSDASVKDFLAHEPPPRRYLLKDCLPLGKVGAIIAPGGTGKSQFVLQVAISVASGLPLAGAWEIGEPGGVLALFAEDDEEELHRRVHKTVNSLTHEVQVPNLFSLLESRLFMRSMVAENNLMTQVDPTYKLLYRTDYAVRLICTAREVPDLKLIIIDPASRFRGGVENAAEDMTRFVEALEYVRKETGATVLVVHHANKQSTQGTEQTQAAARGSSAFSDGVRWQMNLSGMTKDEAKTYGIPDEERYMYLSATMTKNNYAAPQPPVFLRRLDGGVLVKAELSDIEKREANDTVLKIVEKIATSKACFSARSFAESYSGKINVFGIGENKLRGFVNQAIDLEYLVKGSDRRGLLSVTELGRQALSLCKKADSAMAG